MKKISALTFCAAALALCFAPTGFARSTPTPSASPSSTAMMSNRPIGYHGKIASIDATAKTFTISGKKGDRTIKITDTTKITKDDAPASMADLKADEMVRGSYWKKANGSMEAKSVKLGVKTEKIGHHAKMASPAPTATATP